MLHLLATGYDAPSPNTDDISGIKERILLITRCFALDLPLLAFVVIAAELGHGESSMGTHAASFSYRQCRSKSNH
jgi:hypothetical protein